MASIRTSNANQTSPTNGANYRWSHRKTTDAKRMAEIIPLLAGKRLLYCQPVNNN